MRQRFAHLYQEEPCTFALFSTTPPTAVQSLSPFSNPNKDRPCLLIRSQYLSVYFQLTAGIQLRFPFE